MADLDRIADDALAAALPAGLREAIDAALAKGAPRAEILRRVKRAAGGKRGLTVLAAEAYLSARQDGRAPKE